MLEENTSVELEDGLTNHCRCICRFRYKRNLGGAFSPDALDLVRVLWGGLQMSAYIDRLC